MNSEESKEHQQLARKYKKLERDYRALTQRYEQTERLRTSNEAAKELSNFYNRLLLRNIPGVIFMLDLELRFVLGNEQTVSALGFSVMNELVAMPFVDLFSRMFPSEWLAGVAAECKGVIESHVERSREDEVVLNDGRRRTYRVTIGSAQEVQGDCQGVVIVAVDITELVETRTQALQASRAKGDFLSTMSHEMRTPLNAIIAMTAIAERTDKPEVKEHSLHRIDDASKLLLSVINDVLDMSKIEAQKFELSPVEFEFSKLLQGTLTVNTYRAEEKHQKFSVDIDPAIPPVLFGDDQRLSQVITNLLSNAVKFTPERGSISLSVYVKECDRAAQSYELEFKITDSGIGISEEQQKQLFTSFQQADSGISRNFGGTGLGLAISKNIIEMMGGRVWIDSVVGHGSTFSFAVKLQARDALPALKSKRGHLSLGQGARSAALENECDGSTTPVSERTYEGCTLLLAEDIDINREIVLTILEPTLLTIDCAENGVQALEMFQKDPQRYNMIFMDLQMPLMDGLEATRRIRALEVPYAQEVPIIAMTANVFREDVEKCLAVGMQDHVGKPININDVFTKLSEYLSA